MGKRAVLAACFAVALTWSTTSYADDVVFNTHSSAGTVVFNLFDETTGNSLLEEAREPVGNCITDPASCTPGAGTVLFQANLGALFEKPNNTPVFSNGTSGQNYTVVASFGVTLLGGGAFSVNPGGVFNIYADTTGGGNDLLGTGFTSGINILSGSALIGEPIDTAVPTGGPITDPTNLTGACASQPAGPLGDNNCLDQFNNNDWANYYSISLSGADKINVKVNTFDPSYFLNLVAGTTLSLTTTQNILAYGQVDPSRAFSSNGVANGDVTTTFGGTNSICGPGQTPGSLTNPCVNGTGSNIVTQTDANTTFQGTAAVPEPATLTLLGFGLIGSAARRRRQAKKQK